jgi:circadian clock protein KaiC
MNRIVSGIRGFDDLVEGGIPEGSVVLISGTPGTGKTIFGLEFLYKGSKLKEPGLYVSFEEKKSNLFRQASSFAWDLAEIEKSGLLHVQSIPIQAVHSNTPDDIVAMILEGSIKRVVIDSLSTLTMNTPTLTTHPHTIDTLAVKRFIYSFVQKLSATGATILLVSHSHTDAMLSVDGVSEFICDGIVKIHSQTLGGDFSRALKIAKMRSTKNNEDIHPLEISNDGLVIHTLK